MEELDKHPISAEDVSRADTETEADKSYPDNSVSGDFQKPCHEAARECKSEKKNSGESCAENGDLRMESENPKQSGVESAKDATPLNFINALRVLLDLFTGEHKPPKEEQSDLKTLQDIFVLLDQLETLLKQLKREIKKKAKPDANFVSKKALNSDLEKERAEHQKAKAALQKEQAEHQKAKAALQEEQAEHQKTKAVLEKEQKNLRVFQNNLGNCVEVYQELRQHIKTTGDVALNIPVKNLMAFLSFCTSEVRMRELHSALVESPEIENRDYQVIAWKALDFCMWASGQVSGKNYTHMGAREGDTYSKNKHRIKGAVKSPDSKIQKVIFDGIMVGGDTICQASVSLKP